MSRYVDLDGLTWDGTKITSKIQEVKTKHGFMSGITTGWLWGDNVPHIDLAEHDAEAINEFVKRLLELDQKFPIVEDDYGEKRPMRLSEMCMSVVEQLKGENNNEH